MGRLRRFRLASRLPQLRVESRHRTYWESVRSAPMPAIQALSATPRKRTLQLWTLLTGKVATCRSFAPV